MSDPSMPSRSEAELRAILDGAVDGIITISERGLIGSVNPAAERLFGYSADEMIGQNVKMLMPAPYRDEHDGYLSNYLSSGDPKIIGIGREVVGRKKDGSTFPMYLAVSEAEHDGTRFFTGIVHDLAGLKKVEDEAKRLNSELTTLNRELEQRVEERTRELHEAQEQLVRREKLATLGQLAGGVAHEIRNPLGVIRNSVYYLKMTVDQLDEDGQECVTEIEREVQTANRIVAELLDFTRDPISVSEVFSVEEVVENVLQNVKAAANVDVTVEASTNDAKVRADRGQVERVLLNLVRNAVQAMTDGGELTVTIKVETDAVTIEVEDTGVGIAKSALESVFEPLYTTKAKGIGLGLAVSRRYAERNGGTLTVESSEGEGTTFRLTLPAHNE